MKKREILDAKINFCCNMLEYKKCVEGNYKMINRLGDIIDSFKKLGVLKDININRSDTIMHNKLTETIKEFKKLDIDPFFFYDTSSDKYYLANFYSEYILFYLSILILEMHECLDKLVDELSFLTKDIEKLTKHVFKIAISFIRGGNMILDNKDCQEKIDRIREELKQYQDKLNELYEFDIKRDYLNIVDRNLKQMFKEENLTKVDFKIAIFVLYNIDEDYLKKIGKEENISTLREMYLKQLKDARMDESILDGDIEPYFTSLSPDSEEILEYCKLNASELYDLLLELENERFSLLSSGEFTRDAPKDIADLMLMTNELEQQEENKKLKK